jgi:DMSO/TMAO reductase YedYZ molybdopterin-dependent catalytic subunit
MKQYKKITIILLIGSLAIVVAALLGCSGQKQTAADVDTDEAGPWISGIGGAYPLVEGLHVTGQPIDIDIDTYRLKISGTVEEPLSLSLAEIQAMEAQRESVTLVCPGFFVDEGYWTGVKIGDLLSRAGVEEGATRVTFISADGGYSASLGLDEVLGEGMLIAYSFDDKPLPKVHGYPLRVVAKDQQGNRWVKWLGEIVVQ